MMGTMKRATDSKEKVQLEISLDKLAQLFESGLICAAEINCLNTQSKKHISDLCLSCCAKKIGCNITILDNFNSNQQFKKEVRREVS